jgi:hypothetical protein
LVNKLKKDRFYKNIFIAEEIEVWLSENPVVK